MNTNPLLVYNQAIPQMMGYPAPQIPTQTVANCNMANVGNVLTTPEPPLVQMPLAPQMNGMLPTTNPYQFLPMPTQGLYISPQLVTPQQMALYSTNNLAVQHPLAVQESQIQNPFMGQNLNNSSLQYKRDPAYPMKTHHNEGYSSFQQGMHSPNHNFNGIVGYRNSRKGQMHRSGNDYNSHIPRKSKKKFGFRSKQNMIDKVYLALVEKYKKRGILASDDEVLRGEDTIRLHVKKFKALQRIEEALMAAERMDSITIARVSIPLSMKNQFQKKGFLVYVQVEKVWMVPLAQKIFRQFEEFKKCDVARHATEPEKTEEPVEAELPEDKFVEKPTLLPKAEKAEEPKPEEPKQIKFHTGEPEIVYQPMIDIVEACPPENLIKNEVVDKFDDVDDFDGLFTGPMVPQRSRGEMGQ